MITEEYLKRSRLFPAFESFTASRLVKIALSRHGTLNPIGNLLNWLTRIGSMPTDLNEHVVERFLGHRSRK